MNGSTIVFLVYFCLVLFISYRAYRVSKDNKDYVTGGRRFSAGTVALSAGAADNSGWLLMAVPGLAYSDVPTALWLMLLLLVGSFLSWTFLAPYLRNYVHNAPHILTLPDLLEHRFRGENLPVRTVAAMIMLIFSAAYAAANITAGAVLFSQIFDLEYSQGIFMVFLFVLIITSVGGFTAVCWMDIFQALLMFAALVIVPLVVLHNLNQSGNISNFTASLANQFSVNDGTNSSSLVASLILSASIGLGWGLGYFGQPHILARFMVISQTSGLTTARNLHVTWYTLILCGAVSTGILGAAFFHQPLADPELVFLKLAKILFPTVLAGVLYASVWAAIMSTINAHLMVAGSILANDIFALLTQKLVLNKSKMHNFQSLFSRIMVVVVLLVAALLANYFRQSVMAFAAFAWAGFGASFSPLMIFFCLGWSVSARAALIGMIVGALTVFIWTVAGLHIYLYEMIAGFTVSFLTLMCFRWLGSRKVKIAYSSN